MQIIITYQTEDGGVAVVRPAPGVSLETVIERDIPAGVQTKTIKESDLPDRHFRAAWEFDRSSGVKVSVEKAKECQRNLWRKLRAPKLAALDLEFMQAVEDSSPSRRNTIKAQKQALRDVTTTELPDDLEAIKNTVPQILL